MNKKTYPVIFIFIFTMLLVACSASPTAAPSHPASRSNRPTHRTRSNPPARRAAGLGGLR